MDDERDQLEYVKYGAMIVLAGSFLVGYATCGDEIVEAGERLLGRENKLEKEARKEVGEFEGGIELDYRER